MKGGGLALKGLQWFLRIIEFCCAAIVLAIFCYFLATLHNHNLSIATYIRAVTGISGAAVVYSALGLVLLWCLAGFVVLSSIAILLDFAFSASFIYIAWATRGGAGSCNGEVNTPFGSGNTGTDTVSNGSGGFTKLPSLHQACQLNTACFAVSLVAIFFFIFSIFVEIALIRHHKKERAFGPSPSNGYTAGYPRRKFWQRKSKRDAELMAGGLAGAKIHPDALPPHTNLADVRTSCATDTTDVADQQLQQESGYNTYGSGVPRPNSEYRTSGVPAEMTAADYRTAAAVSQGSFTVGTVRDF